MRILLIADIHANLVALETVVRDAGPVDLIWCLGDVVGYGPRPNECSAWVEEHAAATVVGNHDWAALGRLDLSDFNSAARAATHWTADQLTPHTHDWLDGLPNRYIEGEQTLVHGSPRHPVWEYILRPATAKVNFDYFDTAICFVGHTHVPVLYPESLVGHGEALYRPPSGETLPLRSGRYIVNPGSVGQPRDGDPRAAYALYDPEARQIEFRRVEYDIAATQCQMSAAGLPAPLVARLGYGM
jgi:diadenosine tetraphosphatase ApaH/serine/threonine PP2A family protein phosphatase